MTRCELGLACLRAGGLGYAVVTALQLVTVLLLPMTHPEFDRDWIVARETIALVLQFEYGVAVALGAHSVVDRPGRSGPARPADYFRLSEVLAAMWCAGVVLGHLPFLVANGFGSPARRPVRDGFSFIGFVPLVAHAAISACLAAVLIVGPGRIGRWIRDTFGPIPPSPDPAA